MKPKLPLAVLTVLGLAPLSSSAQFEPYPGEHPGDEFSEVSVTLFSEPDFRGESVTLPANTAFEDLDDVRFGSGRRVDNRISSVWIEGHAHVTLYDHDDFGGEFITLMESEADLHLVRKGRYGDWDNDASSISVTAHLEEIACEPGPMYPSPAPVIVEPPPVLHPAPHHPPVTVVVSCPIGCTHRPGSGCRRSPGGHGYGHGYHRDPAIMRKIDRAYRDVLRRSPDRDGIRTYYYTMLERDWSESRLRKELRKSDEYHQQTIPAVVNKVYREVLGREPDPAGFQFYRQKMSRDGWYESHLRKALQRSPEYANRDRTPVREVQPQPRTPAPGRSVTVPRRGGSTPPLATSPRFASVQTPAPRARPPVAVNPRPAAPAPPRRVAPAPAPRPVAPKIATRKSSANPPAMKPKPLVTRTRPTPPQLD